MKRVKRKGQDPRGGSESGSGSVRTAVVILILAALLSVALFYGGMMTAARRTEKRMRTVLDACLMRESLAAYGALEDGRDRGATADAEFFFEAFSEQFPGFSKGADGIYRCSGGWGMTEPVLSAPDGEHLRLAADYTLVFPVEFAGSTLFEARIPMRSESRYLSKYE